MCLLHLQHLCNVIDQVRLIATTFYNVLLGILRAHTGAIGCIGLKSCFYGAVV